MLYNVNVILHKSLHRTGANKYLTYKLYIAGQFVLWYFAILQK